jgi:hypothetical protein
MIHRVSATVRSSDSSDGRADAVADVAARPAHAAVAQSNVMPVLVHG